MGENQLVKKKKRQERENTASPGYHKYHPTRKGFYLVQTHKKDLETRGKKRVCSMFYRIFNISTIKCFYFFPLLSGTVEK